MTFVAVIVLALAGFASAADKNIFDDDWTPPKPGQTPATPPAPPAPPAPPVVKPATPVNPQTPVVKPPVNPPAVVAPPVLPAPVAVARKPIPDKAAQDRSRKLMREVYAKQLADKSAVGRRKLAQELLKEADKVRDNPVDQYVLLAGAIEAAKEGGSLPDCVQASDAMGSLFAVDGFALKTDAAAKITPQVADVAAAPQNVSAGLELVDQLTRAEDFATATRICTSLQSLAGLTPPLRQSVQQRLKDLTLAKAAKERYAQAAEKLKVNRDDAPSNLAVGTYLCFCRGDWNAGLPFLARGSDAPLKAAALADVTNPQTPDARTAVGDAWWNAAEKDPTWQTPMKQRAAAWYQDVLAEGKLTGLARVRIEKRLAEIGPVATPAAASGRMTPELAALNAKINSFQAWKPAKGDWKLANGRFHGAGDSRLEFNTPMPIDCTVSLRFKVISGTRGRIAFKGSGLSLRDVENNHTLRIDGQAAAGAKFGYENGKEYAATFRFSGARFEVEIDNVVRFTGVRSIDAEQMTLYLNAGEGAGESEAEFWDFRVGPPPPPPPGLAAAIAGAAAVHATRGSPEVLFVRSNADAEEIRQWKALPGLKIRVMNRKDANRLLADPNGFRGLGTIVWGTNEFRDSPITDMTDALLQNLKAFVASGGEMVFYEQYGGEKMGLMDQTFDVKFRWSTGGREVPDAVLKAKLAAAGIDDEKLQKVPFYNSYRKLPEGSRILLTSKREFYPMAALAPFGKGRLLLIGTACDPGSDQAKVCQAILDAVYRP